MTEEKLAEEYEEKAECIEVNDYGQKVYGSMEIEQAFLAGLKAMEKENIVLKEENRQLKNEVEDLTAYCNQIGKVKTEVLKAFEHIIAR